MPGILVGIDGSDNSRKALEWAVREAGLRGSSLTVLAVHQVAANHWTGDPEIYPSDAPETEIVRQAAEVAVRAVTGIAAHELVTASADADLVVLGSGGGGVLRKALGSTSSQVVSHAH